MHVHVPADCSSIFVPGWEATGTGFGQIGYGVYEPIGADSVRVVWRGFAAEYSDIGGPYRKEPPPYELWGCLVVVGDRLEYAHSTLPRRGRDVESPPVPAAGLYAWSDSVGSFRYVSALPPGSPGSCRRRTALLPP